VLGVSKVFAPNNIILSFAQSNRLSLVLKKMLQKFLRLTGQNTPIGQNNNLIFTIIAVDMLQLLMLYCRLERL